MARKAIRAVTLLSVALLAFAGCGKGKTDSASGSGAVAGLSPIEVEASDAVMADVKNHWSQTADGWISTYNFGNQFAPNYQRQIRELAVVNVETRQLGDSDKMNGVEWAGQIYLKKSSSREMGDPGPVMSDWGSGVMRTPGQWSQWVDLTPEVVLAQKVKGRWQVQQSTMLLVGAKPKA